MRTSVILAQLAMWKQGMSVHVGDPSPRGHCCPDFSCCHPKLLASKDDRERFMSGTLDERHQLQVAFLARYLEEVQGISGEVAGPLSDLEIPKGLVH